MKWNESMKFFIERFSFVPKSKTSTFGQTTFIYQSFKLATQPSVNII